jgi:hypothetical protein
MFDCGGYRVTSIDGERERFARSIIHSSSSSSSSLRGHLIACVTLIEGNRY